MWGDRCATAVPREIAVSGGGGSRGVAVIARLVASIGTVPELDRYCSDLSATAPAIVEVVV
jgi:hypothetical protein